MKNKAMRLIIIFGIVSLLGDIIYEGARSVNGPYLKLLSLNAFAIGLIVGVGEFLGYALRLITGYLSDRTRSYWFFTFLGYGLLISVPLLSMANIWQTAAILIILERAGKAVRNPARDTILSHASSQVGTGFGFGLHEALDQIGAVAGPLIFVVLFAVSTQSKGVAEYQKGYQLLWLPFLALMVFLFLAFLNLKDTEKLETQAVITEEPKRFPRVFWLYCLFIFITTLGFTNFMLLGYHFKVTGILSDAQIPLFYALAMTVDGLAALAIGKLYDRLKTRKKTKDAGLNSLIIIPVLSLIIPVTVFSKSFLLCLIGVGIWGIVMGAHETIMRSAIADITHIRKRGTGYGIFNTVYGVSLLIGSALLGFCYDRSLVVLIVLATFAQACAIPVFMMIRHESARTA